MEKIRVLFLCIHNSARSQMAEAYLKNLAGNRFEVKSAGFEAGKLNPFAVEAMLLDHIDISGNDTTNVDELFNAGESFTYVITVCDPEASERCPLFPGMNKKINWAFDDPSSFHGTHNEKLKLTIKVRDKIKNAVIDFISKY